MKLSKQLPKGFKRSKVIPLSEAIKIGAKGSKQITGNFTGNQHTRIDLGIDLVCALGARLKGVGLLDFYKSQRFGNDYVDGFCLVDYVWPYSKKHVNCPACSDFNDNDPSFCFNVLIAHLNDQHKWSFRKIYNFVKKVEKQFADKKEGK